MDDDWLFSKGTGLARRRKLCIQFRAFRGIIVMLKIVVKQKVARLVRGLLYVCDSFIAITGNLGHSQTSDRVPVLCP